MRQRPELAPLYTFEEGAGPWTTAMLADFLTDTDPRRLPDAIFLPDAPPHFRDTDTSSGTKIFPTIKVLPTIEGIDTDYVLRIDRRAKDPKLLEEMLAVKEELHRLAAAGQRNGLGAIVLPHATFASFSNNDRYLKPSLQEKNLLIYTAVKKVGIGENLQRQLKNPEYQELLLALGNTLTSFFHEGINNKYALADISSHDQYSRLGNLYDLGHDIEDQTKDANLWPSVIAAEIDEIKAWVKRLLPSTGKDSLQEALKEVRSRFNREGFLKAKKRQKP